MKPNLFITAIAIAISATIGSLALAGGMGGGGMGGGGRGMMGGGHMMDFGKGYSTTPYPDQYNRYNRYDESYRYGPTETEKLRQEIREKRKELSELYDTKEPDRNLINKKIDELSKLEAELDHRLSETEYQRR